MFIVRHYVFAKDVVDAMKKVKGKVPDDVYVSDDWKEGKLNTLVEVIGFIPKNTKSARDAK